MLGLVVNQAHRFTTQGAFLTFSKYIFPYIFWDRDSLIAELVKNLTAMQEIPVRFLGGEDPLEKG